MLYEELPERPFEVSYDKVLVGTVEDRHGVSTPRRKTRIPKDGAKRGHRRNRSCSRSQENVDSTGCISGFVSVPESGGNDNLDYLSTCVVHNDEEVPTGTYASFVEAVLSDECSFYQLTQRVFVANGWDSVKNEATVSFLNLSAPNSLKQYPQPAWYHLQRTSIVEESGIACLCVAGKSNLLPCVHVRFLRDYGDQRFPFDERMSCMSVTFSPCKV